MKIKQTFLIAMGAVLGLFGMGQAYAQSVSDVRISSITVTPASGDTSQPLVAGDQVYFDVALEVPSGLNVTGNKLNPNLAASVNRPYLQLNMNLRGSSLKTGITLETDELETESTNTAVAFYQGQGANAHTLRFVYTVRPGDLSSDLTYAVSGNQPLFSNNISRIALSVVASANGQPTYYSLTSSILQFSQAPADPAANSDVAVNGYTLTVGDAGTYNEGVVYQGVNPATITATGTVSTFANTALANACRFWVEYYDTAASDWKQVPAGVTAMTRDNATIKQGDVTADLLDDFTSTYAANVRGATTSTFAEQKLFLNIPRNEAAYPAGDTTRLRLCFGVPPSNTTTQTTYSWWEYPLTQTPLMTQGASGKSYSVNNTALIKDESITLTDCLDDSLNNQEIAVGNAGIYTASAGDSFVLTIRKNGTSAISDLSPLYAVVESLSNDNLGITADRYYVELDTTGAESASITFSIPDDVTTGRSAFFRIWVPQLETLTGGTGTIEVPYYLQINTTAHSEYINIVGTDYSGEEYYTPLPTVEGDAAAPVNFLTYTLSFDEPSEERRYALVYPVGEDENGNYVRIDDSFSYADGRKPFDVISEYVRVQANAAPSASADADYVVTMNPNATSATFVVALVNDFPTNYMAGEATNGEVTITVPARPVLIAKSCTRSGAITGDNDDSSILDISVLNRAPTITGAYGPNNAAVNQAAAWNFTVADVASDYLIARLAYGDGNTATKLYVDEAKMEAIMGQAVWEAEKTRLMDLYDLTDDDILERTSTGAEQMTFNHSYSSGTSATWSFTVIDSSGAQTSTTGSVTLESSQSFRFYVLYTPTAPGFGYVQFSPSGAADTWSWGKTFTFTALPRSGDTTATFEAIPFTAGDNQFNGTPNFPADSVSPDKDSFFYKWENYDLGGTAAGNASTVPQGREYENPITVNRISQGAGGGGDGTNPADWQDITLQVVFVAEYHHGDAINSSIAAPQRPNAGRLGDYNQDGVPDGWILNALGDTEASRAMVEGGTVTVPEGDGLPAIGWVDNIYRYGAAAGARPSGSFAIEANNFTAKMRVRGRDDALNAAITSADNGRLAGGQWISNVQWVVAVRPEIVGEEPEEGEPEPFSGVSVGTYDTIASSYTPAWRSIRLYTGSGASYTGNRIPYTDTALGPDGDDANWRVVIDNEGIPVRANDVDGARYHYTTVYVNIDSDSEDYETFRVVYSNPWGYQSTAYVYMTRNPLAEQEGQPEFIELRDEVTENPIFDPDLVVQEEDDEGNPIFDEQGNPVYLRLRDEAGNLVTETFWVAGAPVGVPFPFATAEEAAAVETGDAVSSYGGAVWSLDGQYHFTDTRVAGGMLIDEPFFPNRFLPNTEYMSPSLTSWLDRFPTLDSNDEDGDGLPNGYEYYFWYYASRIAYGSVFTFTEELEDGTEVVHQQQNTAIWPAIDMRHRTDPNDGNGFTLGRRFNNNYNPDLGLTQGNFWTPIPAADVLSAFHPLMKGNPGVTDTDNDGLSNLEELAAGTNPIDCDTDGDGIPDGFEVDFDEVLDPLRNDANNNPDGDYYATATLELYPEYHHLFQVDSFTEASGVHMPTGRTVFYDYEAAAFYSVEDGQVVADPIPSDALTSFRATLADVAAWTDGTAKFAAFSRTVTLSDFDLYQALGFNPNTGWYGGTPSNATTPKFAVCQPVNTQPFTNVQEFNAAVRSVRRSPPTGGATIGNFIARAHSTSDPSKADSNEDGIPDGWANYVGFTGDTVFGRDQDGDGLTAVQEFQCRLANLLVDDPQKADGTWPATLKGANHEIGGATWANKLLPTDPWDPDTDGDTVIDGDEGLYFVYGTTTDASVAGGGGDPNSVDTDGDGIMDGWEFRYGIAAIAQANAGQEEDAAGDAAAGDAAADDEEAEVDLTAVAIVAPDPTNAADRSVDYDRDGLTNYQEYLTGILRHFRYDLGTQAARLYKDVAGEVDINPATGVRNGWKTNPNVYNAIEDLGWSNGAPSHTYAAVIEGEGANQRRTDIVINPIKQQWAADVDPAQQTRVSSTPVDDPAAIVAAFNRKWTSSILVPTGDQLGARDDIAALAQELDMAYLRHLEGQQVPDTTVIYLVGRIDALTAPENYEVTDDALKYDDGTTLADEVRDLWNVRRNQLLRAFGVGMAGDQPAEGEIDAVYTGMANRTQGLTAHYTTASGFKAPDQANPQNAYENALVKARNPGIQQQYRAAIRGLNGGVLINDGAAYQADRGGVFVAPVGYHPALRHYTDGSVDSAQKGYRVMALNFGEAMPVAGEDAAIAALEGMSPFFSDIVAWDPFVTTNPIVADSDADGMDDYWEIFHGLNPILGDYSNLAYGNASDGFTNYSIDKVHDVYLGANGEGFTSDDIEGDIETIHTQQQLFFVDVFDQSPAGKGNPFLNPVMEKNAVTGYDYYSYPWLAGAPFADPDGDGLLNSEEAVNPNGSTERYGTDPSPLWMTDPDNPNSFVTRFYAGANGSLRIALEKWRATELPKVAETAKVDAENAAIAAYNPSATFPYVNFPREDYPGTFAAFFPYEINEGFDTDGDGIPDKVELEDDGGNRGDPQSLRTPSRQQVAYFSGTGAMQSMAEVHFGPYALQTFTIECWVKPDAEQPKAVTVTEGSETYQQVILVDRPWRFYETDKENGKPDGSDLSPIRHNFRLGLKVKDGTLTPFADYTSAGTTGSSTGGTPEFSRKVNGSTINAEKWNHLAVTYNGATLTLYVNGAAVGSQPAALIPANGLISVADSDPNDVQRYTYRPAPILIGAGPKASGWVADVSQAKPEAAFDDLYESAYKGYIDEVRIWNGVRTAAEISGSMSKTFSQADLLQQRYNVFVARYRGAGLFETDTPAELLAMYTFEDLLAGGTVEEEQEGETVKVPATTPYETYPGEKTVGDRSVPGSLLYRRGKNFPQAREDAYTVLPTEGEVYTSYYGMNYPANLRWTHGKDNGTGYECVPMAHSTIAHLPLADVERAATNLLATETTVNGSPELLLPSGSALNVKPADSVYWTPYGAGLREGASSTQVYSVKATGNPYAYRYHATIFFDVPTYRNLTGYSTQVPADLLIFGDAFAKYDPSTWADGSPSTDPSTDGGSEGGVTDDGTLEWFEHGSKDAETTADGELSKGGEYLENEIGRGQTTDTDQDLMPNWWENHYGLDPEDPTGDNGPHGDPDGDYLTNYAEWLARSNPNNPSTAGNGVPDFHIPIWARRGRPTFGLLYTDNDFMEDHWEANYRHEYLTVDRNDAYADADNDGWSNWAEARANFRTGRHSTNPLADSSTTANGNFLNEFPTPAIRLTVDYFGDQNVYTNVTEDTNIVVHGYTADGNNSAPDVTYHLPLTTSRAEGDAGALGGNIAQEMGNWRAGTLSGYVHMGNVVPGSFQIAYTYVSPVSGDVEDTSLVPTFYVTDRSPDGTSGTTGQLYIVSATFENADGGYYESFGEEPIGTIDYATGAYTVDFGSTSPAAEVWEDDVFSALIPVTFEEGELPVANVGAVLIQEPTTGAYFERYDFPFTAFSGNLTARYALQSGESNTFTLVQPDSGHIREGINNFFVFVDFNGDGYWNLGEPAGVPDQHNVDIGFDQVNRTLHVQLTEVAPPGALRFDVGTVLQRLKNALDAGTSTDEGQMTSDIPNGYYDNGQTMLDPKKFEPIIGNNGNSPSTLIVTLFSYTGTGTGDTETQQSNTEVFRKPYNKNKPYISEDEIYAKHESGIPPPESPSITAAKYLVYLVPKGKEGSIDLLYDYCIGAVTNTFDAMDGTLTELVPASEGGLEGGTYRYNTEITFAWKSNVQVPNFQLVIRKLKDGRDQDVPGTPTVFTRTIRGVSAYAKDIGSDGTEQFRYRYVLPRGVGELYGDTLFGNGKYSYTLTLNPYSGETQTLTGTFNIALRESGNPQGGDFVDLREDPKSNISTPNNTEDSYYLRAKIHYAGVLKESDDFGGARIVVEAHYSGAFNGDPIAANSDVLVYDDENEEAEQLNRTIRMTKANKYQTAVGEPDFDGDGVKTVLVDAFFTTDFDVEVRGLPSDDPVYLVAFLDLDGDGERDRWEPWGYATQGQSASSGYYFDPAPITPVRSGFATNVDFYIQDVDVDNDKLADSYEWLSAGKPSDEFKTWSEKLTGGSNAQSGQALWTYDSNGRLALTAYGAQLMGLVVKEIDAETGAVIVYGQPDDISDLIEFVKILGEDGALALIQGMAGEGFTDYALQVSDIRFDGTSKVTFVWDVVGVFVEDFRGTTGETPAGDHFDAESKTWTVTKLFSEADTSAKFAIYGKANLDDEKWTLVADVPVTGSTESASGSPTTTIDTNDLKGLENLPEGWEPKFFKVILSTDKKTATTL